MATAEQSSHSSQYDQKEKKECRSRLIKHAIKCLTTERDTSACVQRDHVERVWKQLHETREAQGYFTAKERLEIEKEIQQWELFHDSQIQTRKPSDLRVCYLGGDNPINDLEVLVENGILCQNVWAIEKDSKTLGKAWESINHSNLRNVRLFKGDILTFLKDFEGQFDIIYFDACGSLPAAKQNTLKVIGYVFLYNKLTSPGALITNFSFPPKQQEDAANSKVCDNEREKIKFLTEQYLTYRQLNTPRDEVGINKAILKQRTDEENHSDYITYQVIDSAYLFIPVQRMLLSTKKSLWDQMFVSRDNFLEELKLYDVNSPEQFFPHYWNELLTEYEDGSLANKSYEEVVAGLKPLCKDIARDSYLRNIGSVLNSEVSNPLCKAWVNEIFPDWKASSLKKKDISLLLLTPLLFSSPEFILRFSNDDFQRKCLAQLSQSLDQKHSKFPSYCDVAECTSTTCLVAGLLYGQLAYPSFPVVDKLLRLSYTAKERQMFSDVFIFDKCRYVYEQFPTVDFACFAIVEPKQQMVFRMAVDGLTKHLSFICHKDVFRFCNVASRNDVTEGGIAFPNSGQRFPERQKVESALTEFLLLKEEGKNLVKAGNFEKAVEVYNKCLVLCPENAVIFANKAHCYLRLNQAKDAEVACNEALRLDPDNEKALYRRAMAFKIMNEYSKAMQDLQAVLTKNRDNKEAKRELSECQKLAGTVTTDPVAAVDTVNRNESRSIPQEMAQEKSTASIEMAQPDRFKDDILTPGFGLKNGRTRCKTIPSTQVTAGPLHTATNSATAYVRCNPASATCNATASVTTPPVSFNTLSTSVPTTICKTTPQTASGESYLLGTDVGSGITQWYFTEDISQSTIDGRKYSNACTFIAIIFGHIYHQRNLTPPVGNHLSEEWQEVLIEAMTKGNNMHDELFDKEGVDVAVDHAIDLVGGICKIVKDHNVQGNNPQEQFVGIMECRVLQQKPSFHVLVVNGKTMLLIVDCKGTLMLVDSHIHGNKGALIARSVPFQDQQQARTFTVWFHKMLVQSHGVGLSSCSLSTITFES